MLGFTVLLAESGCAAPLPAGQGAAASPPAAFRIPFGEARAQVTVESRTYVAYGPGGLLVLDAATGKHIGQWVTTAPGHRSLDRDWVQVSDGDASAVSVFGHTAFLLLQRRGYGTDRTRVLALDLSQPSAPKPFASFLLKGTATQVAALDERRAVVLRAPAGVYPPNDQGLLSLVELDKTGRSRVIASLPSPGPRATVSDLLQAEGQRTWLSGAGGSVAADWSDPRQSAWISSPAGAPTRRTSSLRVPTERPTKLVCLSANRLAVVGSSITTYQDGKPQGSGYPVKGARDVVGDLTLTEDSLLQKGRRIGAGGRDLVQLGAKVFVAGDEGIRTEGQHLALSDARAIDGRGNLLAVARGRAGILLVNAHSLKPVGSFYDEARGRMSVLDVAFSGESELLVADADNGLYVLDVSVVGKPRVKSFCPLANALDVVCSGRKAYVANGAYGLVTVPLEQPGQAQVAPMRDCISVCAGEDGSVFALDAGFVRQIVPGAPALAAPRLTYSHTVPLPMGIPRRVKVQEDGKRAWLANDEGWNVVKVDMSEMARPRLAGVLPTGGFARGVDSSGGLVTATTHAACLLFEEGKIRWMSRLPSPGAIALLGSRVWSESGGQLVGLDVQNGKNPQTLPGGGAMAAWTAGGRQLIGGADAHSWRLHDVTGVPRELASVPLPGVIAAAGHGDRACLATTNEVHWLRLPGQLLGRLPTAAPLRALALTDDWLAYAGPRLGLVDARTRTLVKEVAAVPNAGTYAGRQPHFTDVELFRRDGKAWVAAVDAFYGLRLYSTPDLREVGGFPTNGGDYTGISVDAGTVFVGNNWGGLYRVVGKEAERLAPSVANPGCTGPLARGGRVYFQGNEDRTLYITDKGKSPLGRVALPGSGDTRRFGGAFAELKGNLLYTPGFARILDVSNPASPKLVGECAEAGFAHDSCALAELGGRRYLLLTGADALTIVDVHEPTRPTVIATLPGDYLGGYYFGRGIQVVGSFAYVCNRAQLNIVDISDPRTPRLRAVTELSGFPCDVAVRENRAYVASYYGGLEVVDVRDPAQPARIGHFQRGSYRDALGQGWDNLSCYPCLAVDGDKLHVADYYSGLQSWTFP